MTASELLSALRSGALDLRLGRLYGAEEDNVSAGRERFDSLLSSFLDLYGDRENVALFSVPGRSELSGNHTDHNHGKVIAGSVDLDIIAAAVPTGDDIIRIKCEGFPEDNVDVSVYTSPDPSDHGHSSALIAGVADGFRKRGFKVGGLTAVTSSNVLKGSGLSSSAAFENMIGTMLSNFYNAGSVDFVTLASVSQYAENEFFGKPCGLMDQVACAAGGIVTIDFEDTSAPVVEKIDFDLSEAGYRLCIINTGGSHADLTPDYASVPAEMKSVAAALGCDVLRQVREKDLIAAIPGLRASLGDRAVLRAMHFFEENRRVDLQRDALRHGDLEAYFENVLASGRSSFCYLQNVYPNSCPESQGTSLALCLCEKFLSHCKRPAAWRIHGGGFAGTVQAYVPAEDAEAFRSLTESVFGAGSCYMLRVRTVGAVRLF